VRVRILANIDEPLEEIRENRDPERLPDLRQVEVIGERFV